MICWIVMYHDDGHMAYAFRTYDKAETFANKLKDKYEVYIGGIAVDDYSSLEMFHWMEEVTK